MNYTGACAVAVGLFFASAGFPAAARAAVEASAATPAVWIAHNTIVDLENLPERYSCDDLWYKFRDVLLGLGARRDLKITFDRCGRSPSVHLQFSLPRTVSGSDIKYASLEAINGTLLLKAGRPATLQASDCELVRQIKDTLLNELPVRVRSYRFTCDAPHRDAARYRLSVQTLRPVSASTVAADMSGPRAPSGG